MNCPFCSTELIDAYHDRLWKEVTIDPDDYYYCVRCELTFDRDHLAEQLDNREQESLQTIAH